MLTIPHNYQSHCSKTFHWDTSDSLAAYQQNILDPVQRQKLESFGWLDTSIEYKFNSHGFRTPEFDNTVDAVCFGCSFTMGTGLPIEMTWPVQFSTISDLSVANLAHAGSSNDTAFRIARNYLPLLRPKYALWLQTDKHRLELIDDYLSLSMNILAGDSSSNEQIDNAFVKQWFASESNQDLNLEKNTRAFRNLCNELNIVCIILPRNAVVFLDLARDLKHPGVTSNIHIAKKFYSVLSGNTTF